MVTGRSLPWLQDTATQDVWGMWGAVSDDLYIVDADNRPFARLNLQVTDLALATNRDFVKSVLRSAADG